MSTDVILDEAFRSNDGPTVRLLVEYREVGSGPQSVEIEWQRCVPMADHLVQVLQAALTGPVPLMRYLTGEGSQ